MKVAVIGVGHLGKIHTRIYHDMPNVELVGVADTRESEAKAVAEKFHTQAVSNYRELLGKVDAVSIATPTISHYAVASEFLRAGVHVLVEKPFTTTLAQAEELVSLAENKHLKLQVGHTERCNPIIMELNKRNLQPKFILAQRWSPFRFRSGDIGVVLDLMIHDIDLVQSWIRSPLVSAHAIGTNLIGPYEDMAQAHLVYQSGAVASLTASRVAKTAQRKLWLFSNDTYLEIDCAAGQGKLYRLRSGMDPIAMNLQQGIPSQFAGLQFEEMMYSKMVQEEELMPAKNEPLVVELTAFLRCIQENSDPLVPGHEALKSIQTAEAILRAIQNPCEDGCKK